MGIPPLHAWWVYFESGSLPQIFRSLTCLTFISHSWLEAARWYDQVYFY